jgi:hypothetical protein
VPDPALQGRYPARVSASRSARGPQ